MATVMLLNSEIHYGIKYIMGLSSLKFNFDNMMRKTGKSGIAPSSLIAPYCFLNEEPPVPYWIPYLMFC